MQLKMGHLKGELREVGGCVITCFNIHYAFRKICKDLIQFNALGGGISENVTMPF
jgi:hypothetical protein